MLGFEGGLEIIDTFDQHDGLSRLRTSPQEFIQALARTKHPHWTSTTGCPACAHRIRNSSRPWREPNTTCRPILLPPLGGFSLACGAAMAVGLILAVAVRGVSSGLIATE